MAKKRRKPMPMWAIPGDIDEDPEGKGGHRMTGPSRWCIDYKSESGRKRRVCGFSSRWAAQRFIGLNWERKDRQVEKPHVVKHRRKWMWER